MHVFRFTRTLHLFQCNYNCYVGVYHHVMLSQKFLFVLLRAHDISCQFVIHLLSLIVRLVNKDVYVQHMFMCCIQDLKKLCMTFKTTCVEAQREANRVKNRYVDILPCKFLVFMYVTDTVCAQKQNMSDFTEIEHVRFHFTEIFFGKDIDNIWILFFSCSRQFYLCIMLKEIVWNFYCWCLGSTHVYNEVSLLAAAVSAEIHL